MPDPTLDALDFARIGKELKRAREQRNLTQQHVADQLKIARTTLTAIEKGERRVRAEELIALAHLYGESVNDLVRARPTIAPLQAQFRGPVQRSDSDMAQIDPVIKELMEWARRYMELEDLVGSPLIKKYPNLYDTSGVSVEQVAEIVAIQERQRLGLGDSPIPQLRALLEQEVGIRIFYLKMPSQFSAIYLYDHGMGGTIAINRLHPEERRRWSLTHDYAHFLAHRFQPSVSIENGYQRYPESERFADRFTGFFLMPTTSLKRHYNEIYQSKKEQITVADLCILANYYGVAVAALVYRLEDLRLLPSGAWEAMRRAGLKIRDAQQQLGLDNIPGDASMLPLRYRYLAVEAYDKELISEGQLSRYLGLDRLEARALVDALHSQSAGIGDATQIELDLHQSFGG